MKIGWKWIALVVFALLLAGGFHVARPILRQAGGAAAYVAQRGCLCVFASGRSLAACRAEMPDVVVQIEAELLEDKRAVRAFIPYLVERTARYQEGGGCPLE
jgi:hypothetical protein